MKSVSFESDTDTGNMRNHNMSSRLAINNRFTDQLPIIFQKMLNLNIGIFKCQLLGKPILLSIYIPILNDTSIDLREPQGF